MIQTTKEVKKNMVKKVMKMETTMKKIMILLAQSRNMERRLNSTT